MNGSGAQVSGVAFGINCAYSCILGAVGPTLGAVPQRVWGGGFMHLASIARATTSGSPMGTHEVSIQRHSMHMEHAMWSQKQQGSCVTHASWTTFPMTSYYNHGQSLRYIEVMTNNSCNNNTVVMTSNRRMQGQCIVQLFFACCSAFDAMLQNSIPIFVTARLSTI